MPRSVVPRVAIELDEEPPRTRYLRYDLNALMEIQDRTGIDLLAKHDALTVGPKELAVFVWAGLLDDDETLTVKQVARGILPAMLLDVTTKFQEAFAASFPKAEENGKGTDTPPLAGSSSGLSVAMTSDSKTKRSGG